jgi:hypothetical protein
LWEPDAIGGQSGSGVWSDDTNYQFGLLTWQWGQHGAGQMTHWIYKQSRSRSLVGFPKPDGLIELDDYDLEGLNLNGTEGDPTIEHGFFAESSIRDLPIWAEDVQPEPPTEPPAPGDETFAAADFVEFCRGAEEFFETWRKRFESVTSPTNGGESNGPTYGL